MKKIIIFICIIFILVGCSKKEEQIVICDNTSNLIDTTQGELLGDQTTENNTSTNEGDLKLEDLDVESIIPEFTTFKVTQPNYNKEITIYKSPLVFGEEQINKLKSTKLCSNLDFYKEENDGGSRPIGEYIYKVSRYDYYRGYKSTEDQYYNHEIEILVDYDLRNVENAEGIEIEFSNLNNYSVNEFQTQAEEVLSVMFGNEIAHYLVYAKDTEENKLWKEVIAENSDGEKVKFKFFRAVSRDYRITFKLIMEAPLTSSDAPYEEYTSLIENPPVNIPSIFNNRLGDTFDIHNPTQTFYDLLSIGGDYYFTMVESYNYKKRENPNGTIYYKLSAEMKKLRPDDRLITTENNSFNFNFEFTTDENGNISDYTYGNYSFTLNCQADVNSSRDSVLSDIRKQLELIFGDNNDFSDIVIDNFSQSDYYMYMDHPAKFNFLGLEGELNLTIILDNADDNKWNGHWDVRYN